MEKHTGPWIAPPKAPSFAGRAWPTGEARGAKRYAGGNTQTALSKADKPGRGEEVGLLGKSVLLLLMLLVTTMLIVPGCLNGGVDIVEDPELVAVGAVANEFLGALTDPSDGGMMSGLLAASFRGEIGIEWIETEDGDGDGFLDRSEFLAVLADSKLTRSFVFWQDPDGVDRSITASGLQTIKGPSTRILSNGLATCDLTIALALGHPADRFDDTWWFRTSAAYSVEDIYRVKLELQKIELDWKVTYFEIDAGERQSAFKAAFDTFAAALAMADPATDTPEIIDEYIDTALSVCAATFRWPFYFGPASTPHELRVFIREALRHTDPDEHLAWLGLECVTPMQIDARFGAFHAILTAVPGSSSPGEGGAGPLYLHPVEVQVINDNGRWLLSAIQSNLGTPDWDWRR